MPHFSCVGTAERWNKTCKCFCNRMRVKPPDIFRETSGQFPAVLVVTEPGMFNKTLKQTEFQNTQWEDVKHLHTCRVLLFDTWWVPSLFLALFLFSTSSWEASARIKCKPLTLNITFIQPTFRSGGEKDVGEVTREKAAKTVTVCDLISTFVRVKQIDVFKPHVFVATKTKTWSCPNPN